MSKAKRMPKKQSRVKMVDVPDNSNPQFLKILRALTGKGKRTKVTQGNQQAAKAIWKFKPRKSDALSFVFIGLDGKRLPRASRRKGVMLYIRQDLRTEPLEKKGARVTPRRQTSYNLFRKRKGRKTAIAKWFPTSGKGSAFSHSIAPRSITPLPKERGHVSYIRFADELTGSMAKFLNQSRSAGQYVVYLSTTIKDAANQVYTYNTEVLYNTQGKFDGGELHDWVSSVVYAAIAQELKDREMVSIGSSTHIRNLTANRGESPEDWVDRRGFEWTKQNLEVVKVVKMEYQLKKVKQTTGKAKPNDYTRKKMGKSGRNKKRTNRKVRK